MLGVINYNKIFENSNELYDEEDHSVVVLKDGNSFFKMKTNNLLIHKSSSQEIKVEIGSNIFIVLYDGRLDDLNYLLNNLGIDDKNISDHRIIALLYVKYGLNMFKYLEGDFAFSLYDMNKKRLILARDAIGIKPLFYYVQDNTIMWSSKIKELLKVKYNKNKINHLYMKKYLLDHPIANKDTIYKDIFRLENGQFLVYDNGNLKIDYYYLFKIPKISYKKEIEYYQHFYSLFERSVRNRMRTNQNNISIPLSGGLDSTSIVSMAANILKGKNKLRKNLSIYSIYFKNKDGDERFYIQNVLEKYNLQLKLICGDTAWNFKGDFNFIKELDEPYPLFNRALASLTLEAAVNDGNKIILSGHGGDHIFFTNISYLSSLLKNGKFQTYFKEVKKWGRKYTYYEIVKKSISPFFNEKKFELLPWFNKDSFEGINLSEILTQRFENTSWNSNTIRDFFNTIMRQTGHEWSDQYLASALGIEIRYPFLDKKLMEFMAAVPPNLKIKPEITKYILRESLKELLPDEIYKRTNKGHHGFLITEGFKKEWNQITKYYDFKILSDLGLINSTTIKEYCKKWNMGFKYDLYNASSIMRALALEIWLSNKVELI